MSNTPNLQIALDNLSVSSALESIREVGDEVDILEIGTLLCLAEGMEPVKAARAVHPEKTIIADTKCADAGGTIANMCSEAGADWMTVICSAEIATMEAALEEIDDLQVELYGDWTYEQAQQWQDAGLNQVVYHRSRDALSSGQSWGEEDLKKVAKLSEMGFKVSVTGGLNPEAVKLFKGLDVHCFISGRGIREAEDPVKAAQEFKEEIAKYW